MNEKRNFLLLIAPALLLCSILVLGHFLFYRKFGDKKWSRVFLFIEMVSVLVVCAFPKTFVIPVLDMVAGYHIDGTEIVLLYLFSVVILSMYSYLLGHTITKKMCILKMIMWNVGVYIAVFTEGAMFLDLFHNGFSEWTLIRSIFLTVISTNALMYGCLFSIMGYVKPLKYVKRFGGL